MPSPIPNPDPVSFVLLSALPEPPMSLPPLEMITADAATTEWLRRSDRARIGVLLACLGLTALLSVGRERAELAVFLILAAWLVTAVIAECVLRRRPGGDHLRAGLLAADIGWITATLGVQGVTPRVAPYMFVIAIAAGALSRRATTWLTAWAVVAYGCALGVMSRPYLDLYSLRPDAVVIPPPSVRIGTWVLGAATLIALAYLMRTLVSLLARSEARHRLLFWASPRPMYLYDVDTLRFLAANDATVREYGYSREELLAMTVADVTVSENAEAAHTLVAFDPGLHRHAGTWRHRRRDGSVLDVEMTSHPINVDGRAARLVIVTDVTERTRLEARLRQTQRLEALGRLAGGVAHEFNNLLAAVVGHAELLGGTLQPDGEAIEHVEEIVQAARRGADLTRHMLAFGRRQLLRPEVLDVSGVVRDMERLLRPLLAADVRVTLVFPEPCWARVDRSQLELVIMNLAMNARDAMPGGGSLTMETSHVELGAADQKRHPNVALSPGRYVRVSVSDTGSGIAPEVRDRIFEPFFTTKAVGKGTGLGLSTVYGIVKQSEGYVWVYSEVGHGTTMHVYLPAVPAPEPNAVTAQGAGTGGRVGAMSGVARSPVQPERTVLVVDDERSLRVAASRLLQDAGYRVLEADSEEQALAVTGDLPIDVLLTDVVMPGGGGVGLAERLTARQPGVRTVYMSGYSQAHLVSSGRLHAASAFVAKPFTPQELQEAVSRAAAASGRTAPVSPHRREPESGGSRASARRSRSAP